jgi:2-polyprenyl-3-methyl-5-hydroxy-6-metoxy-1,4-benzoquinol methylase
MNECFERVACNLCGSFDCTEVPIGLTMAKAEIAAFGVNKPLWVVCNRCSLLYQNPRITLAMWQKYYEQSFYREVQSNKEIESGHIAYSYRQFQKVEAWLELNGTKISADFPKSYLDYGCGIGGTLKYLRDKGCQSVNGIEVDPFLVEEGKRIFDVDISNGFEDGRLSGKKFDFIFTHHCLEHVMDLNEFFERSRALMEDNGVLVIVVPTFRYGTVKFDYGTSIAHNFILTHQTLMNYLAKHGLSYIDHCYIKIMRGYDNELWCIAQKKMGGKPILNELDPSAVKSALFELKYAIPIRAICWAMPDHLIVHGWHPIRNLVVKLLRQILPTSVLDGLRRGREAIRNFSATNKK